MLVCSTKLATQFNSLVYHNINSGLKTMQKKKFIWKHKHNYANKIFAKKYHPHVLKIMFNY